ncbi:hypothetical protein CO731_01361 [Aminobacter sp. MSH1]|nr:hypothetical protein CO731_01361 [Aminobacter sp. MSH1]
MIVWAFQPITRLCDTKAGWLPAASPNPVASGYRISQALSS